MSKDRKASGEQLNTSGFGKNPMEWSAEEGFADLMARMERGERAHAPGIELVDAAEGKDSAKAAELTGRKPGRIRWRLAVVLAAVITLTLVMSVSTFGEKVYTPEAVTEYRDGEVVIKINNEEQIVRDMKEEDIYQEIEERLGIYTLRLGYKPKGMELDKVEILEDVGEAKLYFLYEGQTLILYISKDYSRTGTGMRFEGEKKVVDAVDSFWLNQQIDIEEIKETATQKNYVAEIKKDSVAYIIIGAIDYEEFKKILEEIYIKNA